MQVDQEQFAEAEGTITETDGTGIVAGSQEDLIVNVGDRVFFGHDSSDLDSDALELLQDQVAWLKQNSGVSITIEGHLMKEEQENITWPLVKKELKLLKII